MTHDRKLTELLGMESAAEIEVPGLEYAVAAAESVRLEFRSRCLSVWSELLLADPDLANEVRALGWDEAMAAAWLCEPLTSGRSPIAMLVNGDREELLELLRRTMHAKPETTGILRQ